MSRPAQNRKLSRRCPAALAIGCAIAALAIGTAPSASAEDPAAAEAKPAPTLTGDSTLSEWVAASPADRSRVAVGLARNRLAADAARLEVATMAMTISNCLSATARDARSHAWKVAATATLCLTAPEKSSK